MLLLLLSAAQAATLSPGEPLENALALHVTQGGLDNLATALGDVVPESFTQDDMAGDFTCDAGDASPLAYEIKDLEANIEVLDSSLVASDGHLDLDLKLALTATASEVDITGDCTFLFKDLDQSCGMDITSADPIEVSLHIGMGMALQDDGTVDVTVDDVSYDLSTISNPIHDCGFATVVDALLGLNPDFLTDLIKTFVDPLLSDIGPQIESALEDALGSLNLETSFAILNSNLTLSLSPSELDLSDAGLFLGFQASAAVDEIADCEDFGEGSEIDSSGWPDVGETAWDAGAYPYDAGILINKDFVDHLLWNVWASGALCGDLSNLVDLPLDTDFVGNLYGDSFTAYFPEAQPVTLSLDSPEQPTGRFAEDPAIYIDINDLGLDTYAPLDGRSTRMCQVGVNGWIALDPNITADGIAPDLIVDTDAFTFSEPYNELLDAGYSEGIAGLLPTLLGSLIPSDLLPTIALPTWQGIGLDSVVWIPSDDGQWQGGFARVATDDVEPLELTGCGGCGGSDTGDTGGGLGDILACDSGCGDSSGCDGGSTCSTGGRRNVVGGRAAMIAVVLSLIGLRRRDRR